LTLAGAVCEKVARSPVATVGAAAPGFMIIVFS